MQTYRLYHTKVDGMKNVLAEQFIEANDYVYITDVIYENDIPLYRNKETDELSISLDLKPVKTVTLKPFSEDGSKKQDGFLYLLEGGLYLSDSRLSKNAIIVIDKTFYTVENIEKQDKKTSALSVSTLSYIPLRNMYTILKRDGQTRSECVYDRYTSYKEALSALCQLRNKSDGNYYRFP